MVGGKVCVLFLNIQINLKQKIVLCFTTLRKYMHYHSALKDYYSFGYNSYGKHSLLLRLVGKLLY